MHVLAGILGLWRTPADFCSGYTIHQFLLHGIVSCKVLSPLDDKFLDAPDGRLGYCRPQCPAQDWPTLLGNVERMDQVLISLAKTSGTLGQRSQGLVWIWFSFGWRSLGHTGVASVLQDRQG